MQEHRQDARAHRDRTGHSDAHASNRVDDLQEGQFPRADAEVGAEEAKPRTKAEIIALLKTEGERFAAVSSERLAESFLAEQVTMPPGAQPATKSRFEMLLSPKEHEMHHRGQLMLIERMLGIVPHLTRQMQERMAHVASRPRRSRERRASARRRSRFCAR